MDAGTERWILHYKNFADTLERFREACVLRSNLGTGVRRFGADVHHHLRIVLGPSVYRRLNRE